MSEAQQPVVDTPAAPTATTEPTTATNTATETSAPASAPTDASTAAPTDPNVTNPVTEEKIGKNEELITSKAINEGVLNYKGTGLKGLIFSKKYFWLSEAPLEHNHLSSYLSNEKSKDIAHPNVAQATQSGKGLLFFAKRAEDKDHPQGILNIADMTDLAKGDFNDFSVKLHGKKHDFQALNKNERDGWIVALEPQLADAKSHRETLVATEGYKNSLAKYGAPAAVATTSKSRSLSRPGKASKSRERVKDTAGKEAPVVGATTAAPTAVGSTETDTAAPTTGALADPTTTTGAVGSAADNPVDTTATATPAPHHGEDVAAGATAGAAGVGAAALHHNKETKEEKKEDKVEKKEEKADKKASRSQSRGNKRSSIFGGLLGKKDDSEDKKAIKKEEKEEKKEIKAEEKAEKKEEKAEEKAEKKEEKALGKDGKHEGAGTAGGFDAAAVASRVLGEPVLGEKDHTAAPATGAATSGPGETTSALAGTDGAANVTSTATATTPPGTTSKGTKRNSVFGGLFGKKDAPKSTTAATEAGPAVPAKDVPAKDQPSAVAATAPQLDNPVTSPTTGTTTGATEGATAGTTDPALEKGDKAVDPVAGSTASPASATATTPTDKRRTSFFGSGFGTKKEKRAGATSGDELTDGEGKKPGIVGGLFRKASRAASKPAASGATGASTTKTAAPGATDAEIAEKTETKAAEPTEVPLPKADVASEGLTNGTAGETAAEKSDLTPGEIGSNAIASHEKTTPVEATA